MRSLFSSLSSYPSFLHSSLKKPPSPLHAHHLKSYHHHLLTPPFPSSSVLHLRQDLQTLKKFHASLIISNCYKPISIASKLIPLYAQFDDLNSASSVFEAVQEPSNTLIWNSIIKAHVDSGSSDSAFFLYRQMRKMGVEHDSFTFPILKKAILLLPNGVLVGRMIHCLATKMGFQSDVYFCNTMMDVYVKCGCIGYACQVFDEMSERDLVSWTTVISGYVYERNVTDAFELFREMRLELEPGPVTVVVMLQVCCSYRRLVEGRQLHSYVMKRGFPITGSLQNSILKMYSNAGSINEVEIFFSEIERRDVVSWNILISWYISRKDIMEVDKCFNKMQGEIRPSSETLTLVISASGKNGDLFQGKRLHGVAIKSGLYDYVLQTSLLDFYAKCGDMEVAAQIFGEIPFKNSITWSAMISGLIDGGHFEDAIELFRQMRNGSTEPMAEIFKSLVVMMVNRDLVTWTSMIEGCGAHGLGFEALQLFHQMVEEGIEPNSVTFLSLLSACSHSGLLSEGCGVFYAMKWRFGMEPDLNHYTCVVDLLGRCGKLKEALAIILKLVPFSDGRIWGALFAACRVHGNQKLGEYAAKRLLDLEPSNAGYCTLLSNIQAVDERWDEVEEVRRRMKDNDLMKKPGWSCVEANGLIHGFVSCDRLHPQIVEIYETVDVLSRKMHEVGCKLNS
ncbi:hypothetical protein RHGRI_006461 [Rhododendron griersonianum]|uniref:Chlororespiratory reduction 4 n=1 Tax=Rhododendron griersonianum TaxID=479676 RepID=A0AAV6KUP4_9ERIC|nr:hypothetical protein RHGRI_006461 [Rhododendron griersonianum]